MKTYLAVDFGAGSGRVMAGSITGSSLKLEEVYRFKNRQISMGGHVYWDFLALFQEMKNGLRKAVEKGYEVESIGVDTWGVDFGLIDKNGNLLGNPVCYRDSRTDGMPEKMFDEEGLKEHYAKTGIQVMSINTLFQLASMKKDNDEMLKAADKLLFMPDLFSYFLTGVANNEYCISSTSELLDATTKEWNWNLIKKQGFPEHIFGNIVMPGTVRGTILESIHNETGLPKDVKVIAVGSHDTASAVYAVPQVGNNRAFLSSGTWSLLGAELDAPVLTEKARKAGFTNEGGVEGKIRFLQNITGLWMLQRLIAEWEEKGMNVSYDYLLMEAEKSKITSIVDVDDASFSNPISMEKAITDYCSKKSMSLPVSQGEFVLVILQSLAYRYKLAIQQLNALLPHKIEQLCIVGGGSRNKLLNRLTSQATGLPVSAGPVEATAIGNILVQAIASGEVFKRDEIKEIV